MNKKSSFQAASIFLIPSFWLLACEYANGSELSLREVFSANTEIEFNTLAECIDRSRAVLSDLDFLVVDEDLKETVAAFTAVDEEDQIAALHCVKTSFETNRSLVIVVAYSSHNAQELYSSLLSGLQSD
jgi:hypothetical protein